VFAALLILFPKILWKPFSRPGLKVGGNLGGLIDEFDAKARGSGFAEALRICHLESDNIVNLVSIRCVPTRYSSCVNSCTVEITAFISSDPHCPLGVLIAE
jgi:hypothetical protein